MKKISIILLLTIAVVLCSACESKSGKVTCTSTTSPNETTTLKSEYNITYKDGYVTELKTKETIKTATKSDLDTYKEALENVYAEYNKLDYYQNSISIEDDTLISTTVINYNKVDTKKLIEIDQNNAELVKNGKVSYSDVKKMYESAGATCK